MAKCEYCGRTAGHHAKECPSCGAPLQQAPQPAYHSTPLPTAPPPRTQAKSGRSAAVAILAVFLLCAGLLFLFTSQGGPGTANSVANGFSTRAALLSEEELATATAAFAQDAADAAAAEKLVRHYAAADELQNLHRTLDAIVQSGAQDEEYYKTLGMATAEAYAQNEAVRILVAGHAATGSDALAAFCDEQFPPDERVADAGLRQLLELGFRKPMRRMSNLDLAQVYHVMEQRNDSITYDAVNHSMDTSGLMDDSKTYTFATQPPAIVNGQVHYTAEYTASFLSATLDEPISSMAALAIFPNLVAVDAAGMHADDDALRALSTLRVLNARYVYTADFAALAILTRLEGLDISGSGFTSLEGVDALENLQHLGLSNTEVSNLSLLSGMPHLVSLRFDGNDSLTSIGSLAQKSGLLELSVTRGAFADLHALSGMKNLQKLTICNTGIKNADFIAGLTNLTYLNVCDNDDLLTMPGLSGLSGLETLVFDCKKFEDISFLQGLSAVRRLTLYRPQDLLVVADMPSLEEITLTAGYHGLGLSPLGGAQNLRRFTLADDMFSSSVDIDYTPLASLQNLEYLYIGNSTTGNYVHLDPLFNIPSLKTLYLSGNSLYGNYEGIAKLQNLEELYIRKVRLSRQVQRESDGFFTNIYTTGDAIVDEWAPYIGQLPALKTLDIAQNDLQCVEFAVGLAQLQRMVAADNYIVDATPLTALENLVYLDLSANPVADWGTLASNDQLQLIGRQPYIRKDRANEIF